MTSALAHLMESPHVVYRFYGHDESLLYVGVTYSFRNRVSAHRKSQPWWSEVDESRTSQEVHEDRASALAAEMAAIATERPRYNVITSHRPMGERLARAAMEADSAKAELRSEALSALADGGSFAWVSEVTGLSTNTLQRWKKEAGR